MAWIYVKKSKTESLDKEAKNVRHDPPISETSRELFVIQDDGEVFGSGRPKALGEVGFDIII